jgi:hypothetical protein
MFPPPAAISQLSPNASKLFLLFIALVKPPNPLITISLKRLSELAQLSPRACSSALQELRRVNFIASAPHRFQQPAEYLLMPPSFSHHPNDPAPSAHPGAPIPPTSAHQDAPIPPSSAHPRAPMPPSAHHHAPITSPPTPQKPAPDLKTPSAHPHAPTLNPSQTHSIHAPPCADEDIAFLDQLTPKQKAHLLALATLQLERLNSS